MYRLYLIILLWGFLFFKTQAQFITAGQHTGSDYFHDLIPDLTLKSYYNSNGNLDTLFLDLNHDGIEDVVLKLWNSGSLAFRNRYCRIATLNNSQIAFDYSDSCFNDVGTFVGARQMAYSFNDGETINQNVIWSSGGLDLSYTYELTMTFSCIANTFAAGDGSYVGVRIFSGSDTLYGWIKLAEVSSERCTVLEYASNTNLMVLDVYPNPFTTELFITLTSDKPSQFILYNLLSQKFLEQSFVNSVSINTSQLSKGIYFYEVRNKNGVLKNGKVIKD